MSLRFRAYTPEDQGAVRDLILSCYGDSGVSDEGFLHWHFRHAGMLQGMVLAEEEGRIVGIQPMELLPHRISSESIRAGMLTGVMVHPDWRRRGIFTRLVEACEENAWHQGAGLVWTMPNDRSYPGFIKMGYTDPGPRRLFVWSPRPAVLLRKRLPAGLATLFGWCAAPWISRRPGAGEASQVNLDAVLADLAAAAEVVGSQWPGLIQQRDETWLRWRFDPPGSRRYKFFLARDERGTTAAWSAGTLESREGLNVGYLIDHVGIDSLALRASGRALLDSLEQQGAELVLAVVSSSAQAQQLARLGMMQVPFRLAPKKFYTVFRAAPSLPEHLRALLARRDNWYQSFSDWDTL